MLTRRQRQILTRMVADPHGDAGELVYEEGAGGWLDLDRVAKRTVFGLLHGKRIGITDCCEEALPCEWHAALAKAGIRGAPRGKA